MRTGRGPGRIARTCAAAALWGSCGTLALGLALLTAARIAPLPPMLAIPEAQSGPGGRPGLLIVRDRAGGVLATVRTAEEPALRIPLDRFDPVFLRATLAAEDRRFFRHPGIDPLSVARACWTDLRAGRRISGGSTLTQQLVKILDRDRIASERRSGALDESHETPPPARSVRAKLRESWLALVLERHVAKRDILEAYINCAPYGPVERGAAAACRLYFGHPPERMTTAEAALLASLPQAPVRHDPRRDPEAARRGRNRVLARMGLEPSSLEAGRAQDLGLAPEDRPAASSCAPHWIERVRTALPDAAEVVLPVDAGLQGTCTEALRRALATLGDRGADAGAAVVLHNATGEVRAWVGSPDWNDPGHGQYDAALALRQPGSALKPFTYALAFEGGVRPSTVLPDLPIEHPGVAGSFRPRNYSGAYHGPVRARAALANSWNAPAVALLAHVGPEHLLRFLRSCGLASLTRDSESYGLGLTLGDGEVSLMELTSAYAVLASAGVRRPRLELLEARDAAGLVLRGPGALGPQSPDDPDAIRVLDPAAAFLVTSILSDPRARAAAFGLGGSFDFPFPVALKTGTSSDWRDNWAFGYTPEWTVGVWVGSASGEAMDRVSGTHGAILALRAILLALHPAGGPDFPVADFPVSADCESRAVCTLSGMEPGPDCPERMEEWFLRSDPPGSPCSWHVAIPVDLATGARARGSNPAARTGRVLYTVPPPPDSNFLHVSYDSWAREQGWPPLPATASDPAPLSAARLDPRVHGNAAEPRCRILRPPDGALYAIDPSLPAAQQEIALEAIPAGAPIRWSVDGRPVAESRAGERVFWRLRPGPHRIRAERSDATGLPPTGGGSAEVRIEVESEPSGLPERSEALTP